jgi:hypothetical protein
MTLFWQETPDRRFGTKYTLVLTEKAKVVIKYDTSHQNRIYADFYMVYHSSLNGQRPALYHQLTPRRLIVAQKEDGAHPASAVYHFTVDDLKQKAQRMARDAIRAEHAHLECVYAELSKT